ncbi:MAG TPA: glycogen debranching protein [Planctomycetales bacterium]|jgi:predicted glycogen debranching enzyme|nr:glycogen debranching protein [Planctomycetales bacterium]
MENVNRRMPWAEPDPGNTEPLLTREWLLTNGLGGYASGTIAGAATRRYHGLLIAALPAPHGRTMMFNHLTEQVRLPDGSLVRFGGAEWADRSLELHGMGHLKEFRLDVGLPVWRYEVGGVVLEKTILLVHRQNTVHIHYQLVEGDGPIRLWLQPSLHFRPHDAAVSTRLPGPHVLTAIDGRYEISDKSDLPPLRMMLHGQRAAFTLEGKKTPQVLYRIEARRGYESTGELWIPGYFRIDLAKGQDATLVASTEPWDAVQALSPAEAREAERLRLNRLVAQAPPEAQAGLAGELVLAADQFIITPAGRVEDAARARAAGDEVRTVIAGYHWFTDWGRDTMISLEGLTLCTGRHREAGYILRTFAHYVRDGVIPNLFPEGEKEGLYHTADATLWFFHAVYRYVQATGDRATLQLILPKFRDILEHHLRGTRFGIHVDPADGLLHQGQEGYQLTWMDAKVGDWVVTPRRGKAVEINALWYNALRLLENWLREEGDEAAAKEVGGHAEKARASFNRRFWNQATGYLFDVVDGENGDDPSCRPNQVFAISLDHPVLDRERWAPVLKVVRERLVTPVGLRSLAPGSPDYKPKYDGDLRSRDAAYHQGTVWAWLAGPFVDAWLAVHPGDRAGAREFLSGFTNHLGEACLGSISEVFDAEEPFTPRGCIAQAWSVAEVLRAWLKTVP